MQLELSQRAYDNKWVLWGYVPDPTMDPLEWTSTEMAFPYRWVPIEIFDYLGTLEGY